jgi:hypothetical protein
MKHWLDEYTHLNKDNMAKITFVDNDGNEVECSRYAAAKYATVEGRKKGWTLKNKEPYTVSEATIRARFVKQELKGWTDRECVGLDRIKPKTPVFPTGTKHTYKSDEPCPHMKALAGRRLV